MDSSARSMTAGSKFDAATPGTRQAIRGLMGALPKAAGRRQASAMEASHRSLRLRGALDRRLAPALRKEAQAFAAGEGGWTIDMSEVTSWDEAGLAALVYALDVTSLAGKQLTLLDPTPALRKTLEVAQLHHLFAITERDR